jgi:acyl-CoA hydrolase
MYRAEVRLYNERRNMRITTADEAVAVIKSGDRVFIHEAAMAPVSLIEALTRRLPELRDVEIVHLHTEAPAPYVAPEMAGHARHNALFCGANVREAINDGRADYTPVFLSEIPALFRDGTLAIDVAMIQISPPNKHGYGTLGTSVAVSRAAAAYAGTVIAEINPNVPRTRGNTGIHSGRISHAVGVERPLPDHAPVVPGAAERQIAGHIAPLIANGSTLQMGIGAIPNAVLAALREHEELGIHTEMFSDGVMELARRGVITNTRKTRYRRRIITSFVSGGAALYDFVDDNPFVEFHSSDIVNDTFEIAQQHMMVAINSAIEIDLTGQVVADSIGERIYSGIGGQMDFVRGAVLSPGGKAIIALPSTARGGTQSRIVSHLQPGAGVVTTRGHVQYIATEYGIVNLRGLSLRQRADALIRLAHPDFRAELHASAVERRLFTPA